MKKYYSITMNLPVRNDRAKRKPYDKIKAAETRRRLHGRTLAEIDQILKERKLNREAKNDI